MKQENVPVGCVEYYPEHISITDDPPSSFVSEEDFHIGPLIFNRLKDPARDARM